MDGPLPTGGPGLFDGDGYYMGGVIAQRILAGGPAVSFDTPLDSVLYSAGGHLLQEHWRIRTHLIRGSPSRWTRPRRCRPLIGDEAILEETLPSGRGRAARVIVGGSRPTGTPGSLYQNLMAAEQDAARTLPFTLKRMSGAEGPALVRGRGLCRPRPSQRDRYTLCITPAYEA